ncbi:MAG: hypothetical protein VSS75_001715 [Candidatus Parabeggiatoa sp.]|nr:hypothetical protein [Candidatus Parabeggiatoa sp.]
MLRVSASRLSLASIPDTISFILRREASRLYRGQCVSRRGIASIPDTISFISRREASRLYFNQYRYNHVKSSRKNSAYHVSCD